MSIPFITLRKFRHPRRLKAWLSVGKTVELLERDQVIARIIPEKQEEAPVIGPWTNRNPSWQRRKG
jgi:hypothetical protein